jgi:putative transposase
MARLPRLIIPNQPHHLIQRGNDRQDIFRDQEDFQHFLQWLREGARQFGVAIHAYVLMSNHFHLLATPQDEQGLSRMMQWLGRYYVPYFNHKYGRTGTLWQGRYRATIIDSEPYFLACSSYIELNPVRAGMVNAPEAYPWSSYLHHVGLKSDPLITDHKLYWALGNTPFERELAYRALVAQGLGERALAEIRHATMKGWALGRMEFIEGLEKKAGRRICPAKRGRPAKKATSVSS